MCLSGSTNSNVIALNVTKFSFADVDRNLFSKEMRRFVNGEIKALKYKKRLGLGPESLRFQGRFSLLTSDCKFEKELSEALKTLDLDHLKEGSSYNRWGVNPEIVSKCIWFSPSAIAGLITVIVSAITACRVRVHPETIGILNSIQYDENMKIVAKHFGLEISDGEEIIIDPIENEEQLEQKMSSSKPESNSVREKFAAQMVKVLLKAQIESLFGMLPKEVADAFDNFRKSERFRDPSGKYMDIHTVLKWHWVDVSAAFSVGGLISSALGLVGYVIHQSLMGSVEERNIIIRKIEELLKSDDLRLPKTDKSSSPSNAKKNSNSVISSKVSSSKLNFGDKKISNKEKNLNVHHNLKGGSVKAL